MPAWIIGAALGSIAITALLTWILWRLNAPPREDDGRTHGGFVAAKDASGDGESERGAM